MNSHDVTAAVAFNSSVKDMEVSSSTLCSTSGRLMVESHPLCLIDRDNDDSVLSASWFNKDIESARKNLPHASLSLPMSQQSQAISLSRSNRDCRVLEEPADTDTDKPLNTSRNAIVTLPRSPSNCFGSLRHSVSCPYNSSSQINETLWSTSRALLPDIIELAVKVRVAGADESQHGIAFLVIFGYQETGSFLMDLPVRLLKKPVIDQRLVGLTKDARLVVKVELFPQTMKPYETTKPMISVEAVPSPKTDRVNLSPTAIEARISCLLNTIEKNEKEVHDFLQAQKHAMEVVVPVKSRDTKESLQRPKMFGSTYSYLTTFIEKQFSKVDQCGMGAAVKYHYPHSDDDSIVSTIATQDSFYF